ncbi:MAG TPA: hypothetical protein VFA85_15745 [Terriglobales bacterium]|nr:hypothetical protein [Terriglobales bacterium]
MVKHNDAEITSSNKITVYLQAGKNPGNEQPHEALVNLQDDDVSVQQFVRHWGALSTLPMVDANRLGWRDTLRRAWRGDAAALKEIQVLTTQYMVGEFKFAHGRIELESNLLGAIFTLFLRDYSAGRAAICANPNCTQPFFLKHRASQKFCGSDACNTYAQSQYALGYWNRDGKRKREEKRKKVQKGRKQK